MLQMLVDIALDLCKAGSAGVSLLEVTPDGEEVFRPNVLAGTLKQYVGGTTPRNFSPCGVCLDRGTPQLYEYPERYFTYFQQANTPVVEGLVLPLIADNHALGTIWITSHDEQRHFDLEDVRVMTSLADFTAAALLLNQRQTRELLAVNAALEAEIVERKQAEERSRALIENLPGGAAFVVDRDLRYLLAEGEALSAAGFKPEDMVGHTIFEVLPPELVANYEVLYRKALAGESFEHEHNAHNRSYISRGTPLRSPNGEVYAALAVSYDITDRKRAEEQLRRATEFDAFRVALSDALRSLNRADEIQSTAAHILGEHLQVDRAYYSEVEPNDEYIVNPHDYYTNGKTASIAGRYRIKDYSAFVFREIRANRPVVIADAQTILEDSEAERAWYAAIEVRAFIAYPLFKAGRLVAVLGLTQSTPHAWTEEEVALVEETAERTWAAVERVRAEAALRESEERFRRFVTASSDTVYKMSADWSEMRSLVGKEFIASTENPSHTWLQEYIPEEDQPKVRAANQEAIRTKSTLELEHRVIRLDGTIGWTFSRAIPVLNAQGEVIEWFGAASDVTERKQAEEARRESEQRLSVIFAQAAVGLSEISLDGHFQQVNDALCRLLGRSRSELLAASVSSVTHPDDVPTTLEALAQLIETGEPVSLDKRYLRPDGTILWANSILTRLDDEQGNPRHVLVVTVDLSDRKQAQANQLQLIREQAAREEERQQAEALAELDRAKTVFFSNVSHEFRTPLTLLLTPLQDALSDRTHPLSPSQRERLELAHRNAMRLLKLVNTLLDYSRIEAGRVEAVYEPTDLALFTIELASVFRSAIERAGLRLIVDCPPLPELVYVERQMWEKIVLNLLSNAFKFTLSGEIAVRLHPADRDRVMLQIHNTGTGIPPEELPHLFERFYQVRGAKARTHEGSGIGLALVHELIRLHGGTVDVSSTVGQGTCFTITIPLGTTHLPSDRIVMARTQASTALGAAPYVEEAQRWLPQEEGGDTGEGGENSSLSPLSPLSSLSPVSPARILLVDDNADMRDYLTRILGEHVQVEAVADGAAALAAAQERVPDLVLSDVMMPGLDGFELLLALRASPRTREVPIILLSARAGEESVVEGLEAGADDYLIKPFSAQELVSRVNAHLQMAQLRGEALRQERTTSRRKDELLSTVSHELNTPLVAILGWTRLLRSVPPSQSMLMKSLDTIERNATLQAKLIQDLLDISRLNAGKLRLSQEPVELESVIETAIATVSQTAEAKHIDLVWWGMTGFASDAVQERVDSVVVIGDRDHLQQVICNLLSNAIKFTPEAGSVTVELSMIKGEKPELADYAEIRVMDTGIGISADFLPHVFDRFRQAEGADSAKGLGLGLAIARHLVELHNGTIHAESSGVGQGATFTVKLPILQKL